MRERDALRVFDLELAREIVSLQREELWRFVEGRMEQLLAMPRRISVFILPPEHPRAPRKPFDEFFDDDPSEVRQMLISDLCYRGAGTRISYHARCGYLDSVLSVPAAVEGSAASFESEFPWPEGSEAWQWSDRFDILSARHVGLMISSLDWHRDDYVPLEAPASGREGAYPTPADRQAELESLTSIHYQLVTDPRLRAAYFYR